MTVFLGLGSNLGNREENIEKAIDYLSGQVEIEKVSDFIETEPYGYLEQPRFINCVIEGQTELIPNELLLFCLDIEKKMGRIREIRWGPRNIDIDVLFYDNLIINEENLIIPHPEIEKRIFVLEPLNQIAPNFTHPVLMKSVSELYIELLNK